MGPAVGDISGLCQGQVVVETDSLADLREGFVTGGTVFRDSIQTTSCLLLCKRTSLFDKLLRCLRGEIQVEGEILPLRVVKSRIRLVHKRTYPY